MASTSGGFLEPLLNDFRNLSTEARRKHDSVKDAAEASIVKIRNAAASAEPKEMLKVQCDQIIHPLLLGCSTKNPKIVQTCLQAIQRALQMGFLSETSVSLIIEELRKLTDAECEELKVLQTITLFVSSLLLVTGSNLSKCIVMAIKLNFSKDPSVINAASAAVRQLFSTTFERVVQEDGLNRVPTQSFPLLADTNYQELMTVKDFYAKMNICAADSFLLLNDLMSLIQRKATTWIVGVKRFTMTLALELLESILKNYPSVFFKHLEHAIVLRDHISPMLLFLLTGKMAKSESISVAPDKAYEKPPFPIIMRCLRIGLSLLRNYHEIVEIHCVYFIEYVIHLLASKQAEWQAAAALEVIHKLVGQPVFIRWLCSAKNIQPNGARILQGVIRGVTDYGCKSLLKAVDDESLENIDQNQPGFLCGEMFIPLHENVAAKRWILLDWLEKHEAGVIPTGYCISLSYASLIDFTHSIYWVVEELGSPSKSPENDSEVNSINKKLATELYTYTSESLLHGLVHFLIVSVEDSVTESLLNCLSTIVILACKTGGTEAKDAAYRALCRNALPQGYYDKFIKIMPVLTQNGAHSPIFGKGIFDKSVNHSVDNVEIPQPKLEQVIAIGSACPSHSYPASNDTFSVTAKNMKIARTLVLSAEINGSFLTSSWDMILTTLQHFTWLLGMKPLPDGGFRTASDGATADKVGMPTSNVNIVAAASVLTTAAINELPSFNHILNKVMESSVTFDDVSLHHVIASLCELSSDQMKVAQKSAREISFFAIAKLLQTSVINLSRLDISWRPITAHLVETCGHSNVQLREWGSIALSRLVMAAMGHHLTDSEHDKKQQLLIMTPLSQLNEVPFLDVKQRQLDCLMNVLETANRVICQEVWEILIGILSEIAQDQGSSEKLIECAHTAVNQISKEFLEILPFNGLQWLLRTVGYYGTQKQSVNIALSAIGNLWHIADRINLRCVHHSKNEIQEIWFLLFSTLGKLCVDERSTVRKSACDTLLQTVACHCHDLTNETWQIMFTKVIFPLLDNVSKATAAASNVRIESTDNQKFLVHHSRDTPAKQWAETTVRTLFGAIKIFNTQRHALKLNASFKEMWATMLHWVQYTATLNNPEMSLAALKDFHELIFGKVDDKVPTELPHKNKQAASNTLNSSHEANELSNRHDSPIGDTVSATFRIIDVAPSMDDDEYLAAWKSWQSIGKELVTPIIYPDGQPVYRFIPGPFHWTTYLQSFPALYNRIQNIISCDSVKTTISLFQEISMVPRSPDHTPFSLTTANPDLSPSQEALFECVRVLAQNMLYNQNHRGAFPNILAMLLTFTKYSYNSPKTQFTITDVKQVMSPISSQSFLSFSEVAVQHFVDYYSKTATMDEVLKSEILHQAVKTFSEPLTMRYHCPSSSIWVNAASAFIAVCRVGLSIVRQNPDKNQGVLSIFAVTIEKFIFAKKNEKGSSNADERKRFEFADCQMIELIRMEILPYATVFPSIFMHRIIDVLTKASIVTLDPNDTLASELVDYRADLCKVSFNALLSLCQTQIPKQFLDLNNYGLQGDIEPQAKTLGGRAIAALLIRCSEVLNGYARDDNGRLPLLAQRITEAVSVLRAISALIDGLTSQPTPVVDSLYQPIINIYPCIVQLIPSCKSSPDIQLAVMIALNSYQSLLKMRVPPIEA